MDRQILTVVPSDATIKGAFKGVCSTGFATDYYIYGGTPPYRVTSTFPDSITLVNSIVNTNGGFFEAITNGSCVDPLTFSILDATGRQTTATLHNVEGTEDAPGGDAGGRWRSLLRSYTDTACTGKTFAFVIFGGTPPYNVSADVRNAQPRKPCHQRRLHVSVSGLLTGTGITTRRRPGLELAAEERHRRRSPARRRLAGAPVPVPAQSGASRCASAPGRRANEPTRRAPRADPRNATSAVDERVADASQQHEAHRAGHDLLVAAHQRQVAFAPRGAAPRPAIRRARAARAAARRRRASIKPRRSDRRAARTMPAATASPCSHSP